MMGYSFARRRLVFTVHAAICLALVFIAGTTQRPVAEQLGADLIVRGDILSQQWIVRDEQIGNVCSAEEGDVTPGLRRILRFTVMTPNIGSADVSVGDPRAHYEANDGLFELATCHAHFHFRHYALYELIDTKGNVWKAAKRGFCMLDTDPNPAYYGRAPKEWKYRSCGSLTSPGNQGISAGWADTYRFTLAGQYFVLDGGDNQPVVPPGNYQIRITVNPPFVAEPGEPCPNVDSDGFCHQLPELSYANNTVTVPVYIPSHPGQQGTGPLAGNTEATVEDQCHAEAPTSRK